MVLRGPLVGAQPASSPCDSELSLPPPATLPPGTSPAHARVGHPRSGCRSAPRGPTDARPSASRPHRPQLPLLCCSNSPRLAGAPASPEALSELGGQAPAQSADSGGPDAQSLNASQAPGIGGWRGPHIPHSRCPRTRLQAARPASGRAPFPPHWAPPGLLCWPPCARAPDPASCSPWPSLSHLEPLHASLSVPGEPLHIPHGPALWWPPPGRLPGHPPRAGLCAGPASVALPRSEFCLRPSLLSTLELPQETTLARGAEVSRGHALARSISPGGQKSLSGLGAGAAVWAPDELCDLSPSAPPAPNLFLRLGVNGVGETVAARGEGWGAAVCHLLVTSDGPARRKAVEETLHFPERT